MKLTEYLKLKKPDQTDFYNVEDMNENMDALDQAIHEHESEKDNPHEVTKEQIGLSQVPNVATNDQTPTYGIASVRENLSSGEKLSTAFGKIRRWFADLKPVAFSGSYQDLSNQPIIPVKLPADGGNADTVDGYHADNFMVYKTNFFTGNMDELSETCSLYMQGATSKTIPKSPDKNESVYYGYLTHIRGLNNDWQYQLMKTLTGTLYFRQKKSNVWESAWTAVNDHGNARMVNGIRIYSSIKEIGPYSTISNVCKNMSLSSILVSYALRKEYTDLPQSGDYWNLQIHKDFEGHCSIDAVHFSGGKPGNNCYSHTDATANWEIVWKTNSLEGHTHNNLQGRGKLPAAASSVHREGLSMGYVYNNGYPIPYGNVLRMGGEGDGELLIGWSGTTGEKAPAYIRSCRDSDSIWSDWDKIITEMYLANNLTTTAAGYALDARMGKTLKDEINKLKSSFTVIPFTNYCATWTSSSIICAETYFYRYGSMVFCNIKFPNGFHKTTNSYFSTSKAPSIPGIAIPVNPAETAINTSKVTVSASITTVSGNTYSAANDIGVGRVWINSGSCDLMISTGFKSGAEYYCSLIYPTE